MESVCLAVLLSAALLHSAQCVPAARARLRRDLYEDRVMSLPVREERMMSLPVPEDDWRGRGLEQALQRLVERDQRREQQEEQQRAAYMSSVLRLLSDAERAGLINPELQLEIDQEEDLTPHFRPPQSPPQRPPQTAQDYDETGPPGLTMTRPRAPYWRLVEPQLAQALFQRLDPDVAEALLNKLQQTSAPRENDQDTLRRLVTQIVSSLGPSEAVMSSGRSRKRRDLSDPAPSVLNPAPSALNPAHRRSRRSLEDTPPSDEPALLRVKRLDEDDPEPRPLQGLQRMKRIDTEEDHGSRRRKRRAIVNYSPQVLLRELLDIITE